MDSEYYYHVFRFKDFVVCPAFFASSLKLTYYACLDVTFGSHYYYIFLYSKIDNPLSNFLNVPSQSFCQYSFKLEIPSKGDALLLDFKSRDLKCFISPYEELFRAFHRELIKFRDDELNTIQSSEVDPSYRIIPKEIRSKFKANHTPFFSEFDHGDAAIVHKDSRSFLEIEELNKEYHLQGRGNYSE